MSWTALVPLKPEAERKSRLAEMLAPEARRELTSRMFDHVVRRLRAAEAIERVVVLATIAPEDWDGDWIADRGRGLNAELAAARAVLPGPLLVIHADLPSLSHSDLAALLDAAAAAGCAIAPDRHTRGTNAIALADDRPFAFHFGPDSLALHRHEAGDACAIVLRPGLADDIDTPEDFATAQPDIPGRSSPCSRAQSSAIS